MNLIPRLKLNWYDDRQTKRSVNSGEYDFVIAPEYILDLGAHKGFATEYFATKYPHAIIHAYEPNPTLLETLASRTKKYPNVSVFTDAISDHDGMVRFKVLERDVSSQICEDGIEVPCITLQTAISRLGTPVSLKIDIEGAEYDALSHLQGVREVVGELHPEKAGRSNEEARTLLSRFKNVSIGIDRKGLFRAV